MTENGMIENQGKLEILDGSKKLWYPFLRNL